MQSYGQEWKGLSGDYYYTPHVNQRIEALADFDFLEVTQNWAFFPLAFATPLHQEESEKILVAWESTIEMCFYGTEWALKKSGKMFLLVAFKTLLYKHLYLINFTLSNSSD